MAVIVIPVEDADCCCFCDPDEIDYPPDQLATIVMDSECLSCNGFQMTWINATVPQTSFWHWGWEASYGNYPLDIPSCQLTISADLICDDADTQKWWLIITIDFGRSNTGDCEEDAWYFCSYYMQKMVPIHIEDGMITGTYQIVVPELVSNIDCCPDLCTIEITFNA